MFSTHKTQTIPVNECAGKPKRRNPSPPAGELVSRSPLVVSDRLNGRLCAVVRHRARARGVKAGSWPSSGSPHDLLNCTAVTDPRLRGRRNRKESAYEQRQLFGKYKIVRENAGNWFVRGRSRRVAARRCGGARGRSQGCLEFHWVGGVGLTFTHPYPYHIHIHWVRREWQVVPQCFLIFHFDGVGQSTRKVYPLWLIMKPHLSIHVLI